MAVKKDANTAESSHDVDPGLVVFAAADGVSEVDAPAAPARPVPDFEMILANSVRYSLSKSPQIQLLQFQLGLIDSITVF